LIERAIALGGERLHMRLQGRQLRAPRGLQGFKLKCLVYSGSFV